MSDQNKKIHIFDESFPSIFSRIARHVICYVHQQKNQRTTDCRLHQTFMKYDFFVFNCNKCNDQNNGGKTIYRRIYWWQKG